MAKFRLIYLLALACAMALDLGGMFPDLLSMSDGDPK